MIGKETKQRINNKLAKYNLQNVKSNELKIENYKIEERNIIKNFLNLINNKRKLMDKKMFLDNLTQVQRLNLSFISCDLEHLIYFINDKMIERNLDEFIKDPLVWEDITKFANI